VRFTLFTSAPPQKYCSVMTETNLADTKTLPITGI